MRYRRVNDTIDFLRIYTDKITFKMIRYRQIPPRVLFIMLYRDFLTVPNKKS